MNSSKESLKSQSFGLVNMFQDVEVEELECDSVNAEVAASFVQRTHQ